MEYSFKLPVGFLGVAASDRRSGLAVVVFVELEISSLKRFPQPTFSVLSTVGGSPILALMHTVYVFPRALPSVKMH